MLNNLRAVFFDLDGTLLDTAPDMALALNIQREVHGKEPLPFSEIRPYVSHGAAAMLRVGFGLEPGHKNFDEFRKQYLNIYADNIAVHTELFSGLEELLNTLTESDIAWGIATNKPEFLTIPLLEALNLVIPVMAWSVAIQSNPLNLIPNHSSSQHSRQASSLSNPFMLATPGAILLLVVQLE